MDQAAAARAIDDFLRALGRERTGDLAQTGALVAKAWAEELLEGYGVDSARVLREGAVPIGADEPTLVALRDLDVYTMCPHHLLPAHGRGTVMYLPEGRVAGLGAVARALQGRARRLTLQERVSAEMAELLVAELGARGALCQLRLTHTCLLARGARQGSAVIESLGLAGSFAQPGPDRDMALAALGASPASSVDASEKAEG